MRDRVGIGFRPELALGIFANLEHIDVVEVIADDLFAASKAELRAMQTLARQTRVVLHGVSLGLASCEVVDFHRLEHMARVVGAIEPSFWSEHLAFVRSGGLEVGHLAAPPRNAATVEGTCRNVRLAQSVVGSLPRLENIATLIEPPNSSLSEADWVTHVTRRSGAGLLLDLNNLYTNATNVGGEPSALLARLPLDQVEAVHIAGGKWIQAPGGEPRLLDDHLHAVPDAVYDLLTELAARTRHPLTIVLERDGAYPPFAELAAELARARQAVALGRQRSIEHDLLPSGEVSATDSLRESAARLETYLTRLYVDDDARRSFLASSRSEAERRGFDASVVDALARIDRVGLELAAQSFAAKRRRPCLSGSSKGTSSGMTRWIERSFGALRQRPHGG